MVGLNIQKRNIISFLSSFLFMVFLSFFLSVVFLSYSFSSPSFASFVLFLAFYFSVFFKQFVLLSLRRETAPPIRPLGGQKRLELGWDKFFSACERIDYWWREAKIVPNWANLRRPERPLGGQKGWN